MSRRYGRNQKRAARRRIEQLERREADYTEAYNRDTIALRRQLSKAQDELHRVQQALGPDFIGLSPSEVARRTETLADPEDWRVPVGDGSVTMWSMAYECFTVSDRPQHQIHFRVRLAGACVGYALSGPALYRAPAGYLARQIGEEMARLLIGDIRKAGVQE